MYSFILGDHDFRTKTNCKQRVQQILRNALLSKIPLAGEDLIIVRALFDRHPRKQFILRGREIEQIFARDNCFRLLFTNGEETEFSYVKCFMAIPSLLNTGNQDRRKYKEETWKATSILKVFRNSIYPETKSFRDRVLTSDSVCELCNTTLRKDNCHVDHHFELSPFRTLVHRFLDSKQMSLMGPKRPGTKWVPCNDTWSKQQFKEVFADENFQNDWLSYHTKNALLRLLCKQCNTTANKKSN